MNPSWRHHGQAGLDHGRCRHKRFHFHFTPTSASWMNQIETWFGILSRQVIRRGSSPSVEALVAMIDTSPAH